MGLSRGRNQCCRLKCWLFLFSSLTPCPLKFLGNSRARRKGQKNRSIIITVIILFYFILLDSPILGRVSATSWPNYCGPVTVPSPMRDHHNGDHVLRSLQTVCAYLMSHRIDLYKGCDTGPTIYRPYLRRLGSLTVCRCLIKEALSPKLFWKRSWILVRPGFELAASRSADQHISITDLTRQL